jgi:hypothetical protein
MRCCVVAPAGGIRSLGIADRRTRLSTPLAGPDPIPWIQTPDLRGHARAAPTPLLLLPWRATTEECTQNCPF